MASTPIAAIESLLMPRRSWQTDPQRDDSYLTWILNDSPDGYVLLNKTGHIIYLNSQAKNILAFEEDKTKNSYPFFELIQHHYQLTPHQAWISWPDLEGTPYLVQPEKQGCPARWIKVDSFTPNNSSEQQTLLRLRDCSRAVELNQKMYRLEHSLAHQLRIPLEVLVSAVELYQGCDKKRENTDSSLAIKSISESSTYSSIQLLKVLNKLNESLCGAPCERPLGEWFRNEIELLERSLLLKKNIQLDLAPAVFEAYLNCSQEYTILLLRRLCIAFRQYHPYHNPTIRLTTSIADASSLSFCLSTDACKDDEQAVETALSPCIYPDLPSQGKPKNLTDLLSPLYPMLASCGGNYNIAKTSQGTGLQITFELPLKKR